MLFSFSSSSSMTSGGVFLFACLFVIVLYKESSPIAKQKKEIKNKIKNYKKEGKCICLVPLTPHFIVAEAKEKEELLKHFYKSILLPVLFSHPLARSTDGDASKLKCNIFIVCGFPLLLSSRSSLWSPNSSTCTSTAPLRACMASMESRSMTWLLRCSGIFFPLPYLHSYLTSAYSLINAIQQIFCYSPIINKLHISIPILSVISSVIEGIRPCSSIIL